MNTTLVPFVFKNIQLKEACWIDNIPYFTCRTIGEWLRYKHPRKAIATLTRRKPYINQFSVWRKIKASNGKNYKHHLYNPFGLLLIVFESHLPKARTSKEDVADLTYSFLQHNNYLLPTWGNK